MQPEIYSAPEWFQPTLLLTSTSPSTIARIQTIAATLEPRAIVSSRPLAAYLRDSLSPAIWGSRVAWAIGGLGLALATVGVFGVFAFAVEERRREIGIRMALGAQPWQVVAGVWRTSEGALLGGLAAGFVLSTAGTPLLRHFLYGLSPFDPIAYLQVAAILAATVVLATWIPARRATAVDPAVTLRCD
jgi:hypothetical protein